MKKRKKNYPLIILIIIFFSILINLFISLPKIEWVGLIVLILSAAIIIEGIVSIENNPPHIGIVTFLNKKIWKGDKPVIMEEGLNWLFLKRIIYNVIHIDIKLKEKRFEPQEILTADNVNVKVPMSYAYNVDEEKSHIYVDIGLEEEADKNINDILEGRLREYSRHPEEGPQTWKEMIASGLKTLDYLVKGFCQSEGKSIEEETKRREEEEKNVPILDTDDGYDHLVKISDELPTPILLDWYREKDPPNSVVRKQWGDGLSEEAEVDPKSKWLMLEKKMKELATLNKVTFDEFKEELEKRIKERIILLEKLRLGKAKIKIHGLGIYLVRLTIGDVNPFGDIYLAEITQQKEEQERQYETYEVETDILKAKKLQKALKNKDLKISTEECLNLIMKWKLIKDGKGFIYDGSLGNIAGVGDLISSIMKGGKK